EAQLADYTQAIMDLGATVCTRSSPACSECPLSLKCLARKQGNPEAYPGKKPRKALPARSTVFVLAHSGSGEWLLEQRPPNGIWGGLWCFPALPAGTDVTANHPERAAHRWCLDHTREEPMDVQPMTPFRHTFSHYHLDITPVRVRLAQRPAQVRAEDRFLWYDPGSPAQVGLAAPVVRLLAEVASGAD
ncbi:MAG: NUDIX domain-containing protein, partial [Chromatocurvus sp.]